MTSDFGRRYIASPLCALSGIMCAFLLICGPGASSWRPDAAAFGLLGLIRVHRELAAGRLLLATTCITTTTASGQELACGGLGYAVGIVLAHSQSRSKPQGDMPESSAC